MRSENIAHECFKYDFGCCSLIEVLTMVMEKICEARRGHHPVIASTKFLIRKSRESSLHIVALRLLSRCLSILRKQADIDLNHRMIEVS